MVKSNHALKRKELFSKYKQNHNIFFETGTHHGFSVQIALDLDFHKIISVEIDQDYFLECFDKFENMENSGKMIADITNTFELDYYIIKECIIKGWIKAEWIDFKNNKILSK